MASNWPEEEKTASEVRVWHNRHGQAENFKKELKTGLEMEQRPCGDSGAIAVFFRIGGLAYNLFIGFTRLACPTEWLPRPSRPSAGNWYRWPGGFCVMRGRWS